MIKVRDIYRTWDAKEFNFLRDKERQSSNEDIFIRSVNYVEIWLKTVLQIGNYCYRKIRLELKKNG